MPRVAQRSVNRRVAPDGIITANAEAEQRSINANYPSESGHVPDSMNSSFSPYFQSAPTTNDTPGPGYNTFYQHVVDAEGASTPVLRYDDQEPNTTPIPNAVVHAMRKLEFPTQSSASPAPSKLDLRERFSRSPSVEALRVYPGASKKMALEVLSENSPVNPALAPNSVGGAGSSAPASKPRSQRARKVAPPPPLLPLLEHEEKIIMSPHGLDHPDYKEIKLRQDFTTAEFVDYMVHPDTISWDIAQEEGTGKYRMVFHQTLPAAFLDTQGQYI